MQDKQMLMRAISRARFTMMTTFWRDSAEYGKLPSKEDLAAYNMLNVLERLADDL